jgi:DNA repair protein RecO (recombination protein O)
VGDNGGVSLYRDDGIVLRTQKLGEADRIVTVLTRRNGRIRAVGKGVRRTKSRFGARLEPFNHVDLLLYTGRSLDVITQAETVRAYGEPMSADYPRYTSGTAMLETAERFTPVEKEPTLRQFLLLVGGLRALGEGTHDPRLVLDAYLLRSLAVAGYAPALEECAVCGTPDPAAATRVLTSEGAAGEAAAGEAAAGEAAAGEAAAGEAAAGEAAAGEAAAGEAAAGEAAAGEAAAGEAAAGSPAGGNPAGGSRAFAIAAGGLTCRSCRPAGAATPSARTVALMSALLRGDWRYADATEYRYQVECSGLVAAYVQWHLEHSIRSLRHVEHA